MTLIERLRHVAEAGYQFEICSEAADALEEFEAMKNSTPFMVNLTEAERATLESERARLGLRSMAEVIRHWIAAPPGRPIGDEEMRLPMLKGVRAEIVGDYHYSPPSLTNAKGEPKELPKPRPQIKSRLKGVWKAP